MYVARMLRRLACVLAAASVAVALAAVPAHAADSSPRYYLALGDSLAYGYQPTHVTGQGYVDQLYAGLHQRDANLALVNLGCPGETTGSMRTGGVCPYPGYSSQIAAAVAFLRAHRGSVRLVTLDIGANDLDKCVSNGALDQSCVINGLVTVLTNALRIVGQLRAAAPRARIVGMTYYDPFLAAWLTGTEGQALAKQSIQITAVLNGLLTGLYRLGGFRIADVSGAFSTSDMSLVNGVPLDVTRICQWTWMCAPAPLGPDIHANQAGYGVIAEAFRRVI